MGVHTFMFYLSNPTGMYMFHCIITLLLHVCYRYLYMVHSCVLQYIHYLTRHVQVTFFKSNTEIEVEVHPHLHLLCCRSIIMNFPAHIHNSEHLTHHQQFQSNPRQQPHHST